LALSYFMTQKATVQKQTRSSEVVLIGDVGGTNVRLQLIRLDPANPDQKQVIKPLTIMNAQTSASFIECLQQFLADAPQKPTVGVVGIAGPVNNNCVDIQANIPHWPRSDGQQVKEQFGFQKFFFINDFKAAGLGISRIKKEQCVQLSGDQPLQEGPRSVKAVIGPGTGLGQAFLCKIDKDAFYETFPSEGGHVDFAVTDKEDWELFEFG